MDKLQLRKNRLDLEYHGELQKANALLILLTTGILAFAGTFIWLGNSRLFYVGFGITSTTAFVGGWFYHKSSNRMKEILEEIEKISD